MTDYRTRTLTGSERPLDAERNNWSGSERSAEAAAAIAAVSE